MERIDFTKVPYRQFLQNLAAGEGAPELRERIYAWCG